MDSTILICTIGSPALTEVIGRYLSIKRDFELLVIVDNPAIDRAGFLIKEQADPRLHLVFNEENIGLTRSLCRGVDMARGEIIIRNDDDDLPDPRRVERVEAFFEATPDCDLMFTYAIGVDPSTGNRWTIGGPTTHEAIRENLLRRNFIMHSAVAFRKAEVQRIGNYSSCFRYAQDYELFLRAMRRGLRWGALPEPLVEKVYTQESITVSQRTRQLLCSFAARLLNEAESPNPPKVWRTIGAYLRLLAIPQWARALRRRLIRQV
jgi:glycosyltransferase involved in cell wall biosynthesis